MFNPRIKLRHLVTFLEVARLRSVVKAAVNLLGAKIARTARLHLPSS